MIVGTLEIYLRLAHCHSLKEKRQTIRGVLEKTRRDFGVSIAEVDDQDLWGNATIGVAYVHSNSVEVENVMNRVLEIFDQSPDWEVEGFARDVDRT
jgi:uncharacterized protein YlxP (DUF503 family)